MEDDDSGLVSDDDDDDSDEIKLDMDDNRDDPWDDVVEHTADKCQSEYEDRI